MLIFIKGEDRSATLSEYLVELKVFLVSIWSYLSLADSVSCVQADSRGLLGLTHHTDVRLGKRCILVVLNGHSCILEHILWLEESFLCAK